MNKPTIQDQILDAALPLVVFDGWSDKVLAEAEESLDLPAEDGKRAFPEGGLEALEYFSKRADKRMIETLENDYALSEMKIRERIATAVMVRLRQNNEYREAVRRGLGLLALPWNAPKGLCLLHNTVDAMWIAAGDTSTDYNYYTKRALLSKVYMTTLHVWLDDHSDDLEETQAFLHRRIENVMQIQKFKFKAKEWIDKSPFKQWVA